MPACTRSLGFAKIPLSSLLKIPLAKCQRRLLMNVPETVKSVLKNIVWPSLHTPITKEHRSVVGTVWQAMCTAVVPQRCFPFNEKKTIRNKVVATPFLPCILPTSFMLSSLTCLPLTLLLLRLWSKPFFLQQRVSFTSDAQLSFTLTCVVVSAFLILHVFVNALLHNYSFL